MKKKFFISEEVAMELLKMSNEKIGEVMRAVLERLFEGRHPVGLNLDQTQARVYEEIIKTNKKRR